MIVNGKITEAGFVSPFDRGFTLGDGLFETIPLYNRKPFLLDNHLARMKDGANVIGIDLPFGKEEIEDGLQALSSETEADRMVARLTVTRGQGGRGYGTKGCDQPTWILTCDEYNQPPKALYDGGAKLAFASISKSVKSPLNRIKSTSALERILILDEAKKAGAFETITLTTDGHISSGAAANIFWVTRGELCTPSTECAILPGVTRKAVIDLAKEGGIKMHQGEFTMNAIAQADEVFITNSLIEIMPVANVGTIFDSSMPGTVTQALTQKYSELINAHRQTSSI